ncbi:MAG: GlsB/YeaQ/YmgE family stress response membrane protein [Gemmatimonadetes bacterium]|nr:GlsB/YeaQ/YmgE family stress response membrane protein [Gemmatimonadota bacterium]
MSIIWMLIIGLIAGAVAKLIMPGKDPGGIIVTMLLGVAGAFVGGFLFRALGIGGEGPAGIIGAIVGALILLGLYRLFTRRRGHTTTT